MKLLEGKKTAEDILKEVGKKAKGKNLKLAVVLVGEDPASLIFVKEKGKACKKAGIGFELLKLSSDVEQNNLKKVIGELAGREDISGIVIQLPLPEGIGVQDVLDIIPLKKDVDALSNQSLAEFKAGSSRAIPPVVGAIDRLIRDYKIDLQGKKIVLMGAGKLVGLPLAAWLKQKNIDFSLIDESTGSPELILKQADVIISGVGKPGLINGEVIKDGAIIIDAATVFYKGKLVGDVDSESVSKRAGFLTPVPGGVGPLTVAYLLNNLINLN